MKLHIDYTAPIGKIKPMNAVNNGPIYTKNADQNLGNLPDFKAAKIPYVRNHDASFNRFYGGEHTVDVHMIFRDFDADPYDPASYDFDLTDEYNETIMAAGCEVFYRLGSKIEHESKKYGTQPPKDFHKWAIICEHIIAHMNEGWANGTHCGIKYWEIWNEPDGTTDDAPYIHHKTWGGTREQFFELYEITAKHLKARFPDLKIGGPALCHVNPGWSEPFFQRCKERNIPLDFFSWHRYTADANSFANSCRLARDLLDKYGFTETESILNEWNYVRSFRDEEWRKSLKTEISLKGAAFIAAVMSVCQDAPLDMLMYYDARPCPMNGLFTMTFYERLKGYYPIALWGELLGGEQCKVDCPISDIFVTAAKTDGKSIAMLTYYTDNDNAKPKTFKVSIDGLEGEELSLCLLDDDNDMTEFEHVYLDEGSFQITMKPNTVVVLR